METDAMQASPKRVLAVHDLSCFGRCSLTVALPILSACGATCVCLPTAILSTHTGGFQGFTLRDLTDDLLPITAHWQREGIRMDSLYTGYLCSDKQLAVVLEIARTIRRTDLLTVVDPVLGDDGRLYSGLTSAMVDGMRRLCACADIIVPNLTEAALLLGRPYQGGVMREADILFLCQSLHELNEKNVVLTGVQPDEKTIGAACYDGKTLTLCVTDRVPAHFDGTGDVFCSVLTGACLRGLSLTDAAQTAAQFTHDAIARTYFRNGNRHYGVDFEEDLCSLEHRLEENGHDTL